MAQKFPYLKHDFKTKLAAGKAWKLFEGEQGCTRIDQEGVCLRMDRPPPAPAAAVPSTPQGPVLVEAGKQISNWFKSNPAAPLTPKPPPEPKGPLLVEAWKEIQGWSSTKTESKGKVTLPAFDIQDIPSAMEKLRWYKSADLMRQFFAGRLNYSKTPAHARDAINQEEEYYAQEFVDTKRFTWKWLLGYDAVERAYQKLIAPGYIASRDGGSKSAWVTMNKAIVTCVHEKPPYFMGSIETLAECGGDVFALHRRFQFQKSHVSMLSFLHTDLGGSLGNFSVYAAVARAEVFREDFKQHTVTVTHAYVYAKDNYAFNDMPGEPSQYLGHWNKTGLIYVPIPTLVQALQGWLTGLPEVDAPYNSFLEGLEFAVLLGDKLNEENTYYPVRNRDFMDWQMNNKKERGGNVLSFTDLKRIALPTPLVFPI
jgi:hypothetical protein